MYTFAALACLTVASISTAEEKRLLLDERIVQEVDNAVLRLGRIKKHPANPLFGEEYEWEPRYDSMYPNVLYDEEEKIYKVSEQESMLERSPLKKVPGS